MLVTRPAVTPCTSSRQLCAAAAAPRARACRRQLPGALTFMQPGLCDVPTAADTPGTRSASSAETLTPFSTPAADSEAHSGKAAAGQQHPAPRAWTLQAAGNRLMAAVRSKMLLCAGAAVMLLGVACSGIGLLAGILACAMLLAGAAAVAKFGRRLLPDRLASSIMSAQAGQHTEDAARRRDAAVAQALRTASGPGLQPLAGAPASGVAAWLQTARQGVWAALWQPLLEFREEWQDAMTEDGPYAWAYDASGITIGELLPCFSGVQVLTDPRTGAVASVEAAMRLDSSTAPGSVVLQVLARGPIGKYAFSLKAASVTGRVRLVPVPQHGLLLVQALGQPAVTVQLSTAYPALLPHNRAKLLQVAEIEDMLKEILQGVLGTPDVLRLDYRHEFPVSMLFAAEAAIRAAAAWAANSRSRVVAALAPRPAAGLVAAVPPRVTSSADSTPHKQFGKSPAAPSSTVNASSNSTAVQDVSVNNLNEVCTGPQKNSTVGESAALALAAQKAAWRQQQPHVQVQHISTSTAMKLAAGTAAHSRGPNSDSGSKTDSESGSSKQAAWHLSHTYSTAIECWTGAGHTAKMSAAATAVPASASSRNSAAGALRGQVSTGRLCVDPIHDSSRQKGSAGAVAGNCRQQPTPQPEQKVAASTTSYAVLPALSPASSSTSGPGPELLGASCVLTTPKAANTPAARGSDTSTGRRHIGSSVGSSAAVRQQVAGVTAQVAGSGAGPSSVSAAAGSRLAMLLVPVSGYVLLGAGLVAAGWMV